MHCEAYTYSMGGLRKAMVNLRPAVTIHSRLAGSQRYPSWWGGGWLPRTNNAMPALVLRDSGCGPLGLANPSPNFMSPLSPTCLRHCGGN